MSTISLWLERPVAVPAPGPLPGSCDVVVAGAGLTGLTTALLLARGGVSVVVLEARTVGAGTTGNTTAKISLLQGTRLSTIAARQPRELVQRYVDANRAGRDWLVDYCTGRDVAVQRRTAFTYATTDDGLAQCREELAACTDAGLPATWEDELPVPFPHRGAVRLDDQAQFHPLEALAAMVADVVAAGGAVHEGVRVLGARKDGAGLEVHTSQGMVTAGRLVLATGTPILDRGGYFTRLEPRRSYAAAFRLPGEPPTGMYLSADQPTRSVRTVPTATGELLLVGGNGHVVGRERHTRRLVDDLTRWTTSMFPGAERTHVWSAQDYHPVDELPYVGPLTPANDRALVATGFDKWGMTNAVAAALSLAGTVLGRDEPWAAAFQPWTRHELAGATAALSVNATVAARWFADRVRPVTAGAAEPAEGEGVVHWDGVHLEAVCRVDGEVHRRSAVCPHLYGVVAWNGQERSWDCPLHGSRFAPDGAVLEGPATTALAPRDTSS